MSFLCGACFKQWKCHFISQAILSHLGCVSTWAFPMMTAEVFNLRLWTHFIHTSTFSIKQIKEPEDLFPEMELCSVLYLRTIGFHTALFRFSFVNSSNRMILFQVTQGLLINQCQFYLVLPCLKPKSFCRLWQLEHPS